MVIVDQNSVRLCRKGSNCCPVVAREGEGYSITDDFGGKVTLTESEFKDLKKSISHFTKKTKDV